MATQSEEGFDLIHLFVTVFQPQKGERVTLLTDLPHSEIVDNKAWSDRRKMALDWQRSLLQASKSLNIKVNPLAYFSATGQTNKQLPDVVRVEGRTLPMAELLERSDIVLALTEYSATAPLMGYGRQMGHLRGASMPRVSKSMETTALAADYQEVARRARMLVKRLQKASGASIEFSTGHRLYVDLRYRKAEADNGQCPPGADPPFINLPSGEAYQAPYEGERPNEPSCTEGVIPVSLEGHLALLQVEANRVQEVLGDSAQAQALRAVFEVDPARRNVAELGLGCNPRAVVTGNVLEDEKAGLHWAYGRSEHLGGTVGPDAFKRPENILHTDIVYAADSPIGVSRLVLEFPEGSTEDIIRDGQYTIF